MQKSNYIAVTHSTWSYTLSMIKNRESGSWAQMENDTLDHIMCAHVKVEGKTLPAHW